MPGNYPADVMLLATDLDVARGFYGDTLGLELLLADTQFLTFRCGGDSRLVVTPSTTGTAEAATKASWRVDDLAAEVAWLRARGVQVQDLPELGTVDGIADIGFALAAWFVDPTTTGSACSNSRIPASGRAAPQPTPGRPTSRTPREPRRRRTSKWPMPFWAHRRQAAGIAHPLGKDVRELISQAASTLAQKGTSDAAKGQGCGDLRRRRRHRRCGRTRLWA